MPDLLIELLSEEIPARMQAKAADDLRRLMTGALVEAGLTYAQAAAFATPRRLALTVEELSPQSLPMREERKGPRTDAPEAAIQGFLRATGLTRDRLERRPEKKGEAYVAVLTRPGRPAAEIVAEVLEAVVRDFPWPKSMRWGAGRLRWVRPLHGIVCLLVTPEGAETVPVTIDGLRAGNLTRGHRTHAPESFPVASFQKYEARLKRARVMLRADERAALIRQEAANLAFARGLEVVEDEGLLAEIAGLVEWPVPLAGLIDPEFLHLPPEVLRTSMKEHQKFLSLANPATGRIEGFVTVANIEAPDGGAAILAGNRRVLRARLADARFFWDNDLRVAKSGMTEWAEGLKAVTFHARLGTQAERIDRIAALAREIAPHVGADPATAERAARLAKLDLQSQMVGEFPELQGRMGRHYLLAAGEAPEVAAAAEEHYSPLGPADAVPKAPVSVAVALADKIDMLTGFWAIDEKPTGSKDPFALRRAALGVVRLVLGCDLRLQMKKLLGDVFQRIAFESSRQGQHQSARPAIEALSSLGLEADAAIIEQSQRRSGTPTKAFVAALAWERDLLSFLHDRLKVHLRDQGIPHDVIDACLAPLPSAAPGAAGPGADDLTLLVRRAEALAAFLATSDGENLVQLFKRANNILTQAEERDGVEYSFGPDPRLAADPAERALFAALDAAEAPIGAAMAAEDFPAAMRVLASLRAPLDAFFEAVQINAESPVLRRNRLNLLSRIRALCRGVADLTRLA
jgi:glycyl-tRNA synthetase beta chain